MGRKKARDEEWRNSTPETPEPKTELVPKPIPSDLIWPKPIPVIGLTGEYASGKTLFGLTIDPKRTLVFDEEKSSQTYDDLGIKRRIDLMDEVARNSGGSFKPIDVYNFFYETIQSIKPGEYSVILLDTIGLIESGLADYVMQNPQEFGKTAKQYERAQALFWGDVKEKWKVILADISTRCQSLVFTVHMGLEFKGGEPTGKRKPKGKETLRELASLYLQLERKINPNTKEQPGVPSAIVIKTRLANTKAMEDGEIKVIPLLPPRIPKCTPAMIRKYILNPPDIANLSEEEKAREEVMSEDERLVLDTERAKANQAKAEAELRREEIKQKNREQQAGTVSTNGIAKTLNSGVVTKEEWAKINDENHVEIKKVTKEQIKRIVELQSLVFASKNPQGDEEKKAVWKKYLDPFDVVSAKHLTAFEADILIGNLEKEHDPFSQPAADSSA